MTSIIGFFLSQFIIVWFWLAFPGIYGYAPVCFALFVIIWFWLAFPGIYGFAQAPKLALHMEGFYSGLNDIGARTRACSWFVLLWLAGHQESNGGRRRGLLLTRRWCIACTKKHKNALEFKILENKKQIQRFFAFKSPYCQKKIIPDPYLLVRNVSRKLLSFWPKFP